jgi:peroxiredoxin
VELSEQQSVFDELGIQVAVITYEPPETNLKFAEKYSVQFPILSDDESRYIKAWGLLNEAYKPGSMAYGVPHPGILLVDRNGMIHLKFAEEGYRNRPILDLVIDAARTMSEQ